MNPGGVVLILLGGLALCQLFGGDALERLRIVIGSTPKSSTSSGSNSVPGLNNPPVAPYPGGPVQKPTPDQVPNPLWNDPSTPPPTQAVPGPAPTPAA